MVANPGSPEARKAGCTCPVADNGKGEGMPFDIRLLNPGQRFVVMGLCPLHGYGSGWEPSSPPVVLTVLFGAAVLFWLVSYGPSVLRAIRERGRG